MKLFLTLLLSMTCVLAPIQASYADTIYLARPKSEHDPRQEYVIELLAKILNYGGEKTTTIKYTDHVHSRERLKQLLMEGRKVDIQATATRLDWEQDLLPIRIPVYKGLLGYRVLLIHKQHQSKFNDITDINQLKQLTGVLGTQWSITPVWKAHGFKTVTNVDYESLFKIIHFERADYFPRGVNEVTQEFKNFQPHYMNLAIEKQLGLYLPLPMYYFVTPKKPELAKRLNDNFEKIIADGSFDEFFLQQFQPIINQLGIPNRQTFFINNPNLTPETPLQRKELWYTNLK